MKIDNDKVEFTSSGAAIVQGCTTSVTRLGNVCTGRFIQGLWGSNPKIKEQVEAWIEWLNQGYDKMSDKHKHTNWSPLVYKPQLLVAVTNDGQSEAIEALKEVGFVPSPRVENHKYGKGYELTTWTYALNGFAEEGEKS